MQVYMQWLNETLLAPKITLVGYDRVSLKVNEVATRSFKVTGEQMQLWMDDKTGFEIIPGNCLLDNYDKISV